MPSQESSPNEANLASRQPEDGTLFRESNIPPWRFALLCVGVCLGLGLSMIDTSIVATSLYTIGEEFGDVERFNWVALAYTLTFLGCAAFFSRITEIVGRRNAFVAAFVIFFSFSLGCGFSHNMNTLIACRALQGIGGAGLFSATMIILPEMCPPKFRDYIAPLIGAVIAISGVLGPILGGLFTAYSTWRWVFWMNGPIGFISMVFFYVSWPKSEFLPTIQRRSWKDLDFSGSLLVVSAAVLVVFAFQDAGYSHAENPWVNATFIAPLVVGLICWIGLFAWEAVFEHFWSEKMAALPLVLIRNRVFAAVILNTIFLGFAYLSTLYVVPLRLQVVNSKSPITAGVVMLPMLGATGLGNAITGSLSKRQNRLSETMTVASVLVTLGLALETTVSDSSELEPKFIGFLVFIGLGYGMITASATMFTALESPIAEHAPAQGIIAQSRMLGGSIGIAMSTAVLAVQQKKQLGGMIPPEGPAALTSSSPADIRRTYNDAFTQTMKVCAITSGIGVLLTLGTYRRNRVSLNEQRAEQVRNENRRREAEKSTVPGTVVSQSSA
ncbi:major facilitator superfamily transporter [Diaporthe helianthi]|uniref:Major facilitator superfamily transporter n=1 Tax=Diaporthe helianthi TaxID=158607 RepID=A0A2P5HHK5_DIAHE|nr:major facilitator superfamily transporter [Diaporthe helianthi]